MHAKPFAIALGLVLTLPYVLCMESDTKEVSVDTVGKAVTGAVETISQKILDTTSNATTDESVNTGDTELDDETPTSARNATDVVAAAAGRPPPSEGRAALDDARRAANHDITEDEPGEAVRSKQSDIASLPVSCSGACSELSDALLTAVEGPLCRSLFTTGKCPGGCMADISTVTKNETWDACRTACNGDIVAGAGERWVELCDARQETLIDQGKEAVKTLVGEGLTARLQRNVLLLFFIGVLILVAGVGLGYRRGSGAAQIAYRLQKRRLMGRKNSDGNLPV